MKPAPNSGYSSWGYIRDKTYSESPGNYVRTFLLLQDDLKKVFEYVEPSEESLRTFSYRIHELLMRTCIEVEANFKAILKANLCSADPRCMTMKTYRMINVTHHLSSYEVLLPAWNGDLKVWKPFEEWSLDRKLPWYTAYNSSKHDRHDNFKDANLEALINAIAGLLVVISSQFGTEDFLPGGDALSIGGYDYHDMEPAVGSYFRIKSPDDWSEDEIYDFNWSELKEKPNRFRKFDYDSLML